jgi:hypothetical protein
MSVFEVSNTVTDIDMSKLAPGLYILKLTNPNGVVVKQIIKQ